jgi:flagellar hook-associated protein 1 FlgK
MATISSAFHLIAGALDADQSALNIVANNVANANTTGYTRQVANWQENPAVEINGLTFGMGVSETGATSVRDRVLEERLQQQQQAASASSTRLASLDSVQALFPPNSGSAGSTAGDIGSDITRFFDSFGSLEANPTDISLREAVLSAARTLAGDVSNAASSLNAQRSSLDQEAASVTSQVNALASAIAQLNVQIQASSPNADAGTLEDQRQQDLSKLSQLIGINQITTENNGISLTTASGAMLVSEGTSTPLTTGTLDGETHFFVGTSDVTSKLMTGGGVLGGYLTARDQDIPQVLSQLDQFAYDISTRVNAANNAGADLTGTTGTAADPRYIFNEPTTIAGSAVNMSVAMTDPSEISAATAREGKGDSSNAGILAALANQAIAGGMTPSNFYSNFVTALGSTVSHVQIESTALIASVTQLQTARDSLSGVNLNDEASFMQQFERSYQAASHVFALLNTVMASAINLGVETAVS